jgi:hypothetical protein
MFALVVRDCGEDAILEAPRELFPAFAFSGTEKKTLTRLEVRARTFAISDVASSSNRAVCHHAWAGWPRASGLRHGGAATSHPTSKRSDAYSEGRGVQNEHRLWTHPTPLDVGREPAAGRAQRKLWQLVYVTTLTGIVRASQLRGRTQHPTGS